MSAMDDAVARLQAKGYDPAQIAYVASFTDFMGDLIDQDEAFAERLKRGIDKMSALMASILPDYDEGQLVGGFNATDLDGTLGPLPPMQVQVFITLVGTIMLAGADGPPVVAVYLKEAIDQYVEFIS